MFARASGRHAYTRGTTGLTSHSSGPRYSSYYRPAPPLTTSRSSSAVRLGRPLMFVGSVTTIAFCGAAAMTNHDTNRREALSGSNLWYRRPIRGLDPALAKSRRAEVVDFIRRVVEPFGRPGAVLGQAWISTPEARRTQIGIISVFGGIFCCWNLPVARRFSVKWLWHSPLDGRPATLLTSVFAHKGLPHLAFNSIALYSIGSTCSTYFDRGDVNLLPRSTSRYEYLALFIGAGVFASFVSHAYSVRVLLRRQHSLIAKSNAILPSLGASGAIYSTFVITALAYPDASVALIFLPFVPIPISSACCAMLAIDLIGVWRSWKTFDHVCHLAGALAGCWYFFQGHALFERLRGLLLRANTRPQRG